MAESLPVLSVLGQCPRCRTWVFVRDHHDKECARWMALRMDPSHEHEWVQIGERAARCQTCASLGEIKWENARIEGEGRG